jgi:hypothetical protein
MTPKNFAAAFNVQRNRGLVRGASNQGSHGFMPLPLGFIAPCLPTKAPQPPSGALWLHEIKHDGFRGVARKDGARVRLYSRPGTWTTPARAILITTRRSNVGGFSTPPARRSDRSRAYRRGKESLDIVLTRSSRIENGVLLSQIVSGVALVRERAPVVSIPEQV